MICRSQEVVYFFVAFEVLSLIPVLVSCMVYNMAFVRLSYSLCTFLKCSYNALLAGASRCIRILYPNYIDPLILS